MLEQRKGLKPETKRHNLTSANTMTLRVKASWISLLYMCARVCGIRVPILVSIHDYNTQGETAIAVSLFTVRAI
jgi:hypothetical protein